MNRSVIKYMEEGKKWDAVKKKAKEVGANIKKNWKDAALVGAAAYGGTMLGHKLARNASTNTNEPTPVNKTNSVKATDDIITPKETVKAPEPAKLKIGKLVADKAYESRPFKGGYWRKNLYSGPKGVDLWTRS